MFCNHWSKERHTEWLTQDAQYSFFAKLDLSPIDQKINALNEKLNFDYLPSIPLDQMHLTLMSLASVESITSQTATAILEASKRVISATLPVSADLGEPSAWDEGIVIPLQDSPQLISLRAALFENSQKHVSSRDLIAGANFYPHLTLSYAEENKPKEPAEAIIEPYKGRSFGKIRIIGVDLVVLCRIEHKYVYTVEESSPISGQKVL